MSQKETDISFSKVEGILLVNKTPKKTSFSIISTLRALTKEKKIGHGGTLDPFATGLMVIFIGKNYTTQSQKFLEHDKEYLATLCLGKTTETFDPESEPKFYSDKIPSLEQIENALDAFQGEVSQIPPMFSAKKINGKRLYKLARQGISVERSPIKVKLKITLISYNYPDLEINVECSKGTYIRALANDIGSHLQTGAFLKSLVRTRSGPFHIKDSIDQEALTKELNINNWLRK